MTACHMACGSIWLAYSGCSVLGSSALMQPVLSMPQQMQKQKRATMWRMIFSSAQALLFGSELVGLVGEKYVEGGQGAVALGNVALQLHLVLLAQLVLTVQLGL